MHSGTGRSPFSGACIRGRFRRRSILTPEAQAAAVLLWIALLKLLQAGVWPYLARTFQDRAAAAAYPVSLLLFALVSWWGGIAGIPPAFALLPFAAAAAYAAMKGWFSRERLRLALRWDAAMALAFAVMLEVRFFNPSISYAEKFMDHAFLASIMRTPVVVPPDPWFAGGVLDMYYYLGHWMFGALGSAAGIASPVVFNLMLPTVAGMAAVSLYALGDLLLPRFRWLPVLVLALPNPAFVWLACTGNEPGTVMWESTRVIGGAITEFPLFSFLWGDPHAHVTALFVQTLFIFLLAYAWTAWGGLARTERLALCGCLALALGSMPPVNTWDVLAYAPLLLAFGALLWWKHGTEHDGWMPAVLVPPVAIACYLPYYLQLRSGGIAGIGLVTAPSDPGAFLLANGFFIGAALALWAPAVKSRPLALLPAAALAAAGYYAAAVAAVPAAALIVKRPEKPGELLALAGLVLLGAIELAYLQDGMGPLYFRMNTVFKFSLVAWMLLGTGVLATAGEWLAAQPRSAAYAEKAGKTLAIALAALLLLVPAALPDMDYGYGTRSLDGLCWLETAHPGDAAAIRYLRSLPDNPVIVEAVGDDYTYTSRISSMTGLPAVLGMAFHEQMWRGSDADVAKRIADVRRIYEEPAMTVPLMRAYGAGLLYVGPTERESYDVAVPKENLTPVYDAQNVVIYRISAQNG
ncbi:MAG: hypothetical protein GKC04_06750 [Methanomicrobiales archaeon]|nr:hypothetical protein [Methanomicrobiales archaeon]